MYKKVTKRKRQSYSRQFPNLNNKELFIKINEIIKQKKIRYPQDICKEFRLLAFQFPNDFFYFKEIP